MPMRANTPNAHLVVCHLDESLSPDEVLVNCCRQPHPAVLESLAATGGYGRYSIFAFDPVEIVEVPFDARYGPLQHFAARTEKYPQINGASLDVPFCGGWIGYIGYEAGLYRDNIPPANKNDLEWPLLRFALYDAAAIYDHRLKRWTLVAVDWPASLNLRRATVATRITQLRERLMKPADASTMPNNLHAQHHGEARLSKACLTRSPSDLPSGWRSNCTLDDYYAKVEKVKQYIRAGDIYQANLTQRFMAYSKTVPFENYLRLRRLNPSSHAAYLSWENRAILSASPELFLELRQGNVITRPIKGTAPRSNDTALDIAASQALTQSEKDRAELNMIIDLLRNDLGRVCRYGSVSVVEDGALETHPSVYHRVASISGKLRPECHWYDLLEATFPGGSITGAPKIRAMQIISQLEPTTRGVYCGSIGYLGLDGSLSLSIAIRTLVQIGQQIYGYAGGAITSDSDSAMEYEEMLAKAAGLFGVLDAPTASGRVTVKDFSDNEVVTP